MSRNDESRLSTAFDFVELRGLEPLTLCMPIQQSRYQLRPGAQRKSRPKAASLVELRGLEPLTLCMPIQQSRYQLRPGAKKKPPEGGFSRGAEGTRTPDPLHAMQMRYQLRHSPIAQGIDPGTTSVRQLGEC